MKTYDVLVHDAKKFINVVYRSGLPKGDAKKLVNELRIKGHKAQFASSKNRETENVNLEEIETVED